MSSFRKYFYKNIGDKIRFYRTERGLSQEELSMLLGKNIKYIGHVERCERNISNKILISLMELFQIRPKDFYNFDEEYNFDTKKSE